MAAPLPRVAAHAPASMVLAAGGTRRAAVLSGVSPEDYFGWSADQTNAAAERVFRVGVRHLFISVMRSTQLAEQGFYGSRLMKKAHEVLGDPARVDGLVRAGIRVRGLGATDVPALSGLMAEIERATAAGTTGTFWWGFSATRTSPWDNALRAIVDAGARSHAEAVRAIYGEDIPPIGVYLGFGKPFVSAELIPPLLEGEAAAFWYQQPGYGPVTEQLLRRIFYEVAYMRQTWSADKSARYQDVLERRSQWERELVLGLGQRTGSFWYPADTMIENGR